MCSLPYEIGEDRCSACGTRLDARAPVDGRASREPATPAEVPTRDLDRLRRTRAIASTGSAIVLLGIFAAGVAQLVLWNDLRPEFSRGDPLLLLYLALALAAVLLTGAPGRTLAHYPLDGLLRRGRPRWWKGLLAGAIAAGLYLAANELFARGLLLNGRERSGDPSTAEIVALTDAGILISYASIAVWLIWTAIAPLLGPQLMMVRQRRILAKRERSTTR
ncbi:hypothetical protein GCM10027515_02620 [Schumannella luteola]